MIIIDTTVWINYLNGVFTPETDWLDVELDRRRFGLTDLILCEVLQGLSSDIERRRKWYAHWPSSRFSLPVAFRSPHKLRSTTALCGREV